jgi:hypothetical protein
MRMCITKDAIAVKFVFFLSFYHPEKNVSRHGTPLAVRGVSPDA